MSIFSLLFGSSESPLAVLRKDPASACTNYAFQVASTVTLLHGRVGGQCTVGCEKVNGKVYKITAQDGAGDYYFPYVNSAGGGVGECSVPVGRADGTLVLTGGMNGCALQVNRDGGNFWFYHDLNGSSLRNVATPGEVACRVEYKSYAGALEMGVNKANAYKAQDKSLSTYFEHCIICVKNGGRWKVYVTGLHTLAKVGTNGKLLGTEYVPFQPTLTPCLASFNDA